jgi:hypothetical protein
MFKKILSLLLIFIIPSTLIKNNFQNNNVGNAPKLVKVNQNYQINGENVLDSTNLINVNHQSLSSSSSDINQTNNWNMVTKNIQNDMIDFFYFDENHYSYRQFAYDDTSAISSTSEKISKIKSLSNEIIDCAEPKKYELTDGSFAYYTDGYNPKNKTIDTIDTNISSLGVIGDDDRIVVSDTTVAPYKYSGILISRFDVLNLNTGLTDSLYYGSTGFMEGPDLLVTAGHAIYGDVTSNNTNYDDKVYNPRFPDEIYYYPARNGSILPYGSTTVERVYLEKSYYLNSEKDWACCKLSTKIGNTTGWCGKISYFYQENFPFDTCGYPSSGNYKMYKATANMTYFESNENGYYYRTNLDADGGQSGSPYIVNLKNGSYVCGIHTYTSYYVNTGEAAYSGGIRIDGLMFAFMNSFVASESLYEIKVTDYGFADAYPTDNTTKNKFTIHTLDNGLTFRTKRYRTGYIHNEYIVMSPIRNNIPETTAFIEYSFQRPIEKMYVELAMWRPSSKEILNSSNGSALLQVPGKTTWETKLDLLSETTALPTDRTNPTIYTIEFDIPVYTFRFYLEYTGTNFVNNANRGRICIGDMTLQFQKSNYLPLNWSELNYEPDKWDGIVESNNNCYDYAINNQVIPGTNILYNKQQPGQYAGVSCYPFTKENLVNAVLADFTKYNETYGTNLIFEEVNRYEICPIGTYKVALVSYSDDYHWYRQDADGYWSHKRGHSVVERYDYSNNIIIDPYNADRGNYTNFLGYFAVSSWGNMYVE